ncbi:MAG: hypothetical protein ACYCQJ_13010 [Nitrososphaerales archaeon]
MSKAGLAILGIGGVFMAISMIMLFLSITPASPNGLCYTSSCANPNPVWIIGFIIGLAVMIFGVASLTSHRR